jgi:adenosylhomocysteine nucleosidase
VGQGVSALVSFGLAGGLDPALRPGAVVVPRQVVEDGLVYAADPGLAARFGGFSGDVLLAGRAIVAAAADKAALFAATGAALVDLESGAVARVAQAAGLPFVAVRAVCDPAERTLPPAALLPLRADGGVGLPGVIASAIARPWQIPGLIGLGRDAGRARRALLAVSFR